MGGQENTLGNAFGKQVTKEFRTSECTDYTHAGQQGFDFWYFK